MRTVTLPATGERDEPSGSDTRRGDRAFRLSAAAALALHAWTLTGGDGLRGGADLLPHLRLMEQMGADPGIRSVYAPFYHVFGALLAPLVGLESAPRVFAFFGACAWIAGFRFFQRCVGLPGESSALFALSAYAFGFSWCLPKVEALGYGFLCVGLGLVYTRRYIGAALLLAATFWIHTASALLLGLSGGVLALASRDARALAAMAGGALLATPLQLIHLADGCSYAEALRLTGVDYLIRGRTSNLLIWDTLLIIANPLALLAAGLGASALWREQRRLAILAAALVAIYFNELWLAPFGQRFSLDLMRAMSVLALPVAMAGGVGLAARRDLAPWWLALCALWATGATLSAVPRVCFTRPIAIAEIDGLEVSRCSFSWRAARPPRPPSVRGEYNRSAVSPGAAVHP